MCIRDRLASVLTTFTLGVSVSAISLHDTTGEGRAAFAKIAVYNSDIVKVSGPYDSWETAVKNLGPETLTMSRLYTAIFSKAALPSPDVSKRQDERCEHYE